MAVTIEILSNTRAKLHDIPERVEKALDDALSIPYANRRYMPSVRSHAWDGKKHLYTLDSSTFPKGLLKRVKRLLSEAGVEWVVKDSRENKIASPVVSVIKKRGYLRDPNVPDEKLVFFAHQQKAAQKALKKQCGILWVATNGGKTEIAIALIKALRKRLRDGKTKTTTLFVVGKRKLLTQTRARIAMRLNIPEETIGIIGQGLFIPKEITVATIQSLSKKGSPPAVARLKREVKLLIVDEGHHSKAATWYKFISNCQAQFRYILSGTPFTGDNDLMVEAAVGPVITRISNDTLIKKGISARPIVTFHEITEPDIKEMPNIPWNPVYKQGIVLNTERNLKIVELTKAHVAKGLSVFVIVREIWHGDLIASMYTAENVKHVFVHADMPPSLQEKRHARFEAKKVPVMVASPIFDEGVDIQAADVLIIADGGKSLRAALQKIGRGLRKKKTEANVILVEDFADLGHPKLAEHSLQRMSIYEEEEFEIL